MTYQKQKRNTIANALENWFFLLLFSSLRRKNVWIPFRHLPVSRALWGHSNHHNPPWSKQRSHAKPHCWTGKLLIFERALFLNKDLWNDGSSAMWRRWWIWILVSAIRFSGDAPYCQPRSSGGTGRTCNEMLRRGPTSNTVNLVVTRALIKDLKICSRY